ncbi:MAG: FlgD immunoglobulin-like domain containing protein [Spirochaetota bacterium]
MKKYVLVLMFIFCVAGVGIADQIPGSQYFYLGNGISFFPLGASGAAHYMTMDANLYNPAAYGDTRRVAADISLGGLAGDNLLFNARGSFPTNYGVLTGNFLVLTSPEGNTAGNVVGLKGTFSKYISEEWLFGAGLNAGLAKGPQSDFMTSVDLGTIYRKEIDGTGFGLFDYSIGAAFKNIGKNISYEGYDGFPPFMVDVGAGAEVVRKGIYRARLSSHAAFPINPVHPYLGFGLENIFFDMVNIKVGANVGIEQVSTLSAGFDLNFSLGDTDMQFSYSLLPNTFNSSGTTYTHNAGISIAFGSYDRKPPTAVVEVEKKYFSPNHDGVNDRAIFDLNIDDNSMIFGWRLDITDENGKPVRSFVAQDVRKIRYMTFEKYFKRLFSKKEEVKIPRVIEWDGTDSSGNTVDDGTYYYSLTAWDENENRTVTEKKKLGVDTVVPMVEASADQLLFSPNGDGVKDTLNIDIKNENIRQNDQVVLNITDRSNNVVFSKKLEGMVPGEFVWDGRDNNGEVVEEGIYNFRITAADYAGNKTTSTVEGIVVRTEYEKVSVSPSLRAFSPNGDGYFDINEIKLFASSKKGLLRWSLDILNKEGNVVRKYSGERDFPDTISFNGEDAQGNALPDGLYTLRFQLYYESGNHPESIFKFMEIDTTSPSIEVSTNIKAFSPNGDGIKDTITFIHKITSGEGDIFQAKITNAAGATFKTFSYGKNPPGTVVWDGTGDRNTQPVEGGYTYIITGKDKVGNFATASVSDIKVATGFEEVSIVPNRYVFSPNDDDKKDQVTFKLNATRREGVQNWRLDIKDINGELVNSFTSKKMGTTVPTEIDWDGTNQLGTVVEDGVYTATFSILYDTGNNPISKPKDIKVDTTPPSVEIYVDDLYISPNNDGAKETLTIFQQIQGEPEDEYTGVIKNDAGKVIKKFHWKGSPPSEIMWDGRDQQGRPFEQGTYTYTLTAEDPAGNVTEKTISGIILKTEYQRVSLVADQRGISPNADGHLDQAEFVPSISSTENLVKWYFDIVDAHGRKVRGITGSGVPPSVITWEGKDQNGNLARDGVYTCVLTLLYKSGNHPSSDPVAITVDTNPPDCSLVVSPKLFSPDGDGEADTLYINIDLVDRNQVSTWAVSIYRKWNGKVDRSVAFKTFSGKGNFRGVIRWDGYSDPVPMPVTFTPPDDYTYKKADGKWRLLVDSASTYLVELHASDGFGNSITVTDSFETDIMVIKTPYGMKIMVNSIQFEFDKAELLPQSHEILDRLIEILDKFPNYKILIAGHTDSVGSEEYNQKLSERRAYTVYKYLVEHDVAKERLATEGRGESQPIDDNNTEQGRARNRRVEFYLTKK